MKISEIFNGANINPDNLQVTPITVHDRKGKATKKTGMPDVLPAIMGMDLEYRSYQYHEEDRTKIMYGSALIPFITASGEIMQNYVKEYISTAQLALGEALKIDMAKLKEDGMDGFQLRVDDPNITEYVAEKVYTAIDQAYPLGPVRKELIEEVTACADELLGEAWEKGDNYKAYISYLVIKGVSQYAAQCQQIVNDQILGPIYQILQMRAQEAQVAQRMGNNDPAIVDLLGGKLSSSGAGKIVGLDGREIKSDEVIN